MQNTFHVRHLGDRPEQMMAALYLQVSIVSQALIFVTRSRSWSFVERPGLLLLGAFMVAQLVSICLLYWMFLSCMLLWLYSSACIFIQGFKWDNIKLLEFLGISNNVNGINLEICV